MCGVVLVSLIHVNNLCRGLMIWFPARTSVQTSHAEKFKMVHQVQFLNLAASTSKFNYECVIQYYTDQCCSVVADRFPVALQVKMEFICFKSNIMYHGPSS